MFATKKKLKIFILGFLLVEMFFTYAPARAQTTQYTGVQQQLTDYLCTPSDASTNPTAAQGDLYNCINRLYRFALVVASVFSVFMIVIGGYIYMSAEGNQESVDKAKSILISSVTSLVILAGGYVLLKFLNPDLIKFQPIQPPSVVGQSRSYSFGNVPASGSAGSNTASSVCNQSFNLSVSAGCNGSNCVDVSNYTPNHDCASNGGVCKLSSGAAERLQKFLTAFNQQNSGCTLKISSAIQGDSGPSASSCHKTGTCVDFNVLPSYSSACAQAFYKAAAQSGSVVSFLDEYVTACKAVTTTGGNIHVNF